MEYIIKEEKENSIFGNNISVEDFSYLEQDNYEFIIIKMIKEEKLLKAIGTPNYLIKIIADTIINDRDTDYLIEELTRIKMPLYSLIIGIVDTYKSKYKRLLNLKNAKEIIIECNKENFIKGLNLAVKLNKKVIIEGKQISLGEYQQLLSNYDISSLYSYDIKIDYQENNHEIKINKLYETSIIINNITKEIEKYDLSPLEKIIYAYDKAKSREYKESEENKSNSRDLDKILQGDSIVCVGFSNLFNAILKCLRINATPFVSLQNKHQRSLVYIEDDKYNIKGIYVFDPTNDSRHSDSYIDNYDYFALTLKNSEISHPTDIYDYISIPFVEILRSYDSGKIEDFEKYEDIMSELEKLFNFAKEPSYQEFEEIVRNYIYASSSSKLKALNIYHNFMSKYNPKEISASTFMYALYKTRIIEYYNDMIDDFNIKNIKEGALWRSIKHKKDSIKDQDSIKKLLKVLEYNLREEETLDKLEKQSNFSVEKDKLNIRLLKVLRNKIG